MTTYVFDAEIKSVHTTKWKVSVDANSVREARQLAEIEIERSAHGFCEMTEQQYVGTKVNEVLYAKEC